MWDLFEAKPLEKEPVITSYKLNTEDFQPVNVNSYDSSDSLVVKAWKFLMDRKLFDLTHFDKEPYYVASQVSRSIDYTLQRL